MKRNWLWLTLVCAVLGFAEAQDNRALVRLANLSPDGPRVELWVRGNPVPGLGIVESLKVSGYVSMQAGNVPIEVMYRSADIHTAFRTSLTLQAGGRYTLAVMGFVFTGQGKENRYKLEVIPDLTPTPNASGASLRLFHAAPDAPRVKATLAGNPPVALASDLEYSLAGTGSNLPSGDHTLEVQLVGAATPNRSLPLGRLEAGRAYTVFLVGSLGGGGLAVVVTDDTAP